MHRLIYISRDLIGDDHGERRKIVAASAIRNEACGVTGMLWFDGVNFAQVLEGDRVAIDETMARIRADNRHTNIQIVCERQIKHRMFQRWSMALPDHGPDSASSTAFLIGIARSVGGEAASRLYEIVIASDDSV
jgi:hypothetical protein